MIGEASPKRGLVLAGAADGDQRNLLSHACPASGYFHRSWVNLPWGTSQDEFRHQLIASYRLVRSSLTKKAQAELDPFEPTGTTTLADWATGSETSPSTELVCESFTLVGASMSVPIRS